MKLAIAAGVLALAADLVKFIIETWPNLLIYGAEFSL